MELEFSLDFLGAAEGDAFYFNAVGASPVPLPGAVWLLGSALGLLAFGGRRVSPSSAGGTPAA